jgi:hypothetical protein
MRRSFATLLIAVSIMFGMPALGNAQAGRSDILHGQIVDAAGRGSSGRAVELISEGMVVGMTTSSFDGRFSFAVGGSGSYVVRTFANGHPAGIRISVVRGQNLPMALLVLPSVATSSAQVGAVISGAVSTLTSLASVVAVGITSSVVTNITEKKDDEILASPEAKQDLVAVLNQIVQALTPAGQTAPVITFNPQTGAIVIPPGGLGNSGIPADVVTAINNVVINVPAGSGD